MQTVETTTSSPNSTNVVLAAACQNIWYIPLPSGITQRKSCHKKAVKFLNGVSMCERCYNKRSAKSSS